MLFKKNIYFLGILALASIGCSSSNTASKENLSKSESKKIYELNLTDQQISSQGGVLELYQNNGLCTLRIELLSDYGKETYDFEFKTFNLKKTIYHKYKYVNGILNYGTDDDRELQELMVDTDKKILEKNDLELITKNVKKGDSDKELLNNFRYYLDFIPQKIVLKNCQ